MNRNGQGRWFDHMVAKAADPNRAAALQSELDSYRWARIRASLTTRPIFIPLTFEMTAAGRTSPYRATTPQLGYDVLITGIKSDTQTRDVIIKNTQNDKSLVYVGDEQNLYLRIDELAGQTVSSGGGQRGVFYLPTPIPLTSNTLTFEMFKTDTTDADEEANIVLVGVRTLPGGFFDLTVDDAERVKIDKAIWMREIPANVPIKQLVDFDTAVAGGQAVNLSTPKVEEPLLILGIRTSLLFSEIEFGIQGEASWTVGAVPIWGVAGEADQIHDNYQWFSKPIFLHSNRSIDVRRITNGINFADTSLIDAQTGNTITWLCQTV